MWICSKIRSIQVLSRSPVGTSHSGQKAINQIGRVCKQSPPLATWCFHHTTSMLEQRLDIQGGLNHGSTQNSSIGHFSATVGVTVVKWSCGIMSRHHLYETKYQQLCSSSNLVKCLHFLQLYTHTTDTQCQSHKTLFQYFRKVPQTTETKQNKTAEGKSKLPTKGERRYISFVII